MLLALLVLLVLPVSVREVGYCFGSLCHPGGLGEIVTSLVQAGLRIEFLHEYDFESFGRFGSLLRREDGTYRFPPGQPRVPMMSSLRASAPGTT